MVLSRKQKITFYKNRKKIDEVILKEIKRKGLILFGARSLNRQLPKFLRKDTKDYDIILLKRNPKTIATQLEKKLDKKFKGNFFTVEQGKKEGVFKVKRVLGNEGVVDVVRTQEKVPTIKKKGVRVSTLAFEKRKIRESLADPKSMFRHEKDRERQGRIRIAEELKRRVLPKQKRKFKSFVRPRVVRRRSKFSPRNPTFNKTFSPTRRIP